MSTALVAAGHLKAEIRLAQAISEFEIDLTSEQKAHFRAERTQRSSLGPTAQDVMRLTAEIDSRTKARRCFGPRFMNILHAVQKFASIGDVVVGGSQNLIACGVWSVVRIGLLAIPSSISILERLSAMFMAIGRSAPRHEKLAVLYSQSHDLHNLLCEYYIILVKLCHKIVKTSKKSTIGQLISPMSESDLTSYQSTLEQYAVSIRDEVQILTAQRVESESAANSKFRELSTYFSNTAAREQRLQKRARALATCSTYNYEKTWKQLRKVGKATIHQNHQSYSKWRDSPQASTLVLNGKLGSGKSVLMANIVDDLFLSLRKSNALVIYFFCSWNISESLSAKTILASLLRQVINGLQDSSDLDKAFDKILNTVSLEPSIEDLVRMLLQIIPKEQSLYFVIDGLGDCPGVESLEIQRVFGEFRKSFKFHLCISQRTEANSVVRDVDYLELAIPIHENHDIEQFIVNELERCIDNGSLILGDPKLVLEIHDALRLGADGMMLWVSLQIQTLCQKRTDASIRESLKDLPKSLSETFSRIMKGTGDPENARYQQRLFTIVLASLRPLNLAELREALSVEPGKPEWNEAHLINDIRAIVSNCNGLCMIDEDDETVQLVHLSFKQYLTSHPIEQYNKVQVHRGMADIIVTYLSYSIFERQLVKSDPQVTAQAIPQTIVKATLPAGAPRNIALKLLRQKKAGSVEISKTLLSISASPPEVSSFYEYGRNNLRHHAWSYIVQPSTELNDLILKVLPDPGIKDPDVLMQHFRSLSWDTEEGLKHMLILKYHLSIQITDGHGSDNPGPFIYDSAYWRDKFGVTPWTWAVKFGYTDVLLYFMSSGYNPYRTSLQVLKYLDQMLQHGYLQVAEKMLDYYPIDLNHPISSSDDQTSLQKVVLNSYPKSRATINLLLQNGASPNVVTQFMPSPFFLALSLQKWDMAGIFLRHGAGIEHRDDRGRTMLINLCAPDIRGKAISWLVQHNANVLHRDSFRVGIFDRASQQDQLNLMISILRAAGIPPYHSLWDQPYIRSHRDYDHLRELIRREYELVQWTDLPDSPTEEAIELTRISISYHKQSSR